VIITRDFTGNFPFFIRGHPGPYLHKLLMVKHYVLEIVTGRHKFLILDLKAVKYLHRHSKLDW